MPADELQTIDMGATMETEPALAIIDALNEVSDVQAMSGPNVTFTGTRVASFEGIGRLEGVDVYSCPRGWLILFRVPGGPHWCVAGSTASEAVASIEDDDLKAEILQRLSNRQLL